MTAAAWYTLGTALTWAGYALVLRCFWLLVILLTRREAAQKWVTRGLVIASVSGAIALIAGSRLVSDGRPAGISVPLVWWVMPFFAWVAVISLVLAIGFAAVSQTTLTNEARASKLRSAGAWFVVALLAAWLFKRDPENEIHVLKGAIPLTTNAALAIAVLAVAGIAAMVLTDRAAKSRKLTKGIVTQLSLIAGSIVFGVPLIFLLITSFKEDRDMSSANGIVWVPRVQRTMPYLDPKSPHYETSYQGQTVQATITNRSADGSVKMDVVKPLSLRGIEVDTSLDKLKLVPRDAPIVQVKMSGIDATGLVVEDLEDGRKRVRALTPASVKDQEAVYVPEKVQPVRDVGLRWQNYTEAVSYLPPDTEYGLVFLRNTLIIAILSVIGTILSSSLAAYSFARLRFPGRDAVFALFLATMMLPGAVTMLPQFLIYRKLGWIDTLLPLWAPAFFGSAFNIFLLRQFFRTIPMELEDAAKIDGCSYGRTFWSVMLPQIKPALAVIGVTTFMASWNNFMGPLIYINSPEKMPISYALQLYMGDRGGEPGLLMAFVVLTIIPILLLFFFAQRYFIEGVTLSGLGGK